jgi:hypothetical protein
MCVFSEFGSGNVLGSVIIRFCCCAFIDLVLELEMSTYQEKRMLVSEAYYYDVEKMGGNKKTKIFGGYSCVRTRFCIS